jgi:hypothetical protein
MTAMREAGFSQQAPQPRARLKTECCGPGTSRDSEFLPPSPSTDVDFPTSSPNTDNPSKNTSRKSGEVREERHDDLTTVAA